MTDSWTPYNTEDRLSSDDRQVLLLDHFRTVPCHL